MAPNTGMPRISIVLPLRNAATTLTDCLDSIARQTFTDYEILAVNDGSHDATVPLLRERQRREPRLRILDTPRPGLVNALNLGLQQAHGPYVARMDGDDRMRPDRLELQWQWLQQHPEVSVVSSRVELFPASEIQAGMQYYVNWMNQCLSSEQIHQDIYLESPMAHPSVMYHRNTIIHHGGYREGGFPEDYELWLRLHQRGIRFGKVNKVLLEWREHPLRVSRCDPRCSRAAFDHIRAHYLSQAPFLKQKRPLAIWGAGRKTRRRVRPLLERGIQPDAWIDIDPRKIGQRLGTTQVRGPEWLFSQTTRPIVLIYVASHGAREDIADWLEREGLRAGEDYCQVG